MDFLLGLLFTLLFVSDSKIVHNFNTTVTDSVLLPCSTPTTNITDLTNLRFYWQDNKKEVLYSFNKGQTMPKHISNQYVKRVSAFRQDMITGNISVLLDSLTLEDNGKIFEAYATVFNGPETILETTQVCRINLYVTVPYKDLRLAVNTETMTSVCTVHGGFPAPEIHWITHHNGSEFSVNPRDVDTTTAQDPESLLYTSSSTLHIPAGPHQALTCLCHNPTLNATLNATYNLSKGAAVWSLPGRSAGLAVAAAVLLTALQQL